MRTQSADTSPEAERVQIELIRKAPITKRIALMEAWSQFLIEANKQGLRERHPDASEEEVQLIFVANNYGQELADKVRTHFGTRKRAFTSFTSFIPDIIRPIIDVLEQLDIKYYIGGAVSSAFYGTLSAAIEANSYEALQLVTELQHDHIRPFLALLQGMYHLDANAIHDAIQYKSVFNAIHLKTLLKIDIAVSKARLFDQEELHRTQLKSLMKDTRAFYIASPEGTILNKLEWYKMGGGVSDRQWNDILGVLKVQGTNLDMAYLQRWASALDVAELLQRALVDAGLMEE